MTTQYAITDEFGRNSAKKLMLHDTEILNQEARIALSLIEKWGMVTAQTNGEDTAGRARLIECSPNEVVNRACTIASQAMEEFRKRDWVISGPDISKLMKNDEE